MSFLNDLQQMPPGLRHLYHLRADFNTVLKRFHTWHAVWKASVLVDDQLLDEDEIAAQRAESAWQELGRLEQQILKLQRELGIDGVLVEMPVDAYEEKIVPMAVAQRKNKEKKQ